jgi:hypothetical protein
MKRFALVEPTGRVAQVESDGDVFEVAEPLAWFEAPAGVAPGWKHIGDQFVAPLPVHTTPPSEVTMRQARLALLAAGKLDAVAIAIAALPSPQREAAQIEWDHSSTVARDSQVVALLGPALGLDEEALDALFRDASAR